MKKKFKMKKMKSTFAINNYKRFIIITILNCTFVFGCVWITVRSAYGFDAPFFFFFFFFSSVKSRCLL